MTCSALESQGINQIWETVQAYHQHALDDGSLQQNRQRQSIVWMDRLVTEILQHELMSRPAAKSLRNSLEQQVRAAQITPYSAARKLAQHS